MAAGPTLSTIDYIKKLVAASNNASPEVSRDFVMEDLKARDHVYSIVEDIGSDADFASERTLSLTKAEMHPQYYAMGGFAKGGLAAWKMDAFPVDYFVRHFDRWRAGKSPQAADFSKEISQQPWFKWQGNSLTLQTSGANARLLELLQLSVGGPSVKLYRGTVAYEAHLFEFYKINAGGKELPTNWRDTLIADYQAVVDHTAKEVAVCAELLAGKYIPESQLVNMQSVHSGAAARLQELKIKIVQVKETKAIEPFLRAAVADHMKMEYFKGLFTTPSLERAKSFSKGHVNEFEVSFTTLNTLLTEESLFVGLEKMMPKEGVNDVQVEIAFMNPPGGRQLDKLVDVVLNSYRGSTAVSPGYIFKEH